MMQICEKVIYLQFDKDDGDCQKQNSSELR